MCRTRSAKLVAVLFTGMLVVGCSSGGGGESADMGGDSATEEAAQGGEEASSGAQDDSGGANEGGGASDAQDGGEVSPASSVLGRRVVREADLELRVEDPDEARDRIEEVADAAGGFLATTDLRRDEDGVLSGSMVLRVPSEELTTVVTDLEDLATRVPVSRIDERDVTVETTNLEAELDNLRAYETELRELLADVREGTDRADDLLPVYERLREVRGEIDRASGQLDVLDDQVSLSTVRVELEPSPAAIPVSDPGWAPGETLRSAVAVASRGLAAVADAAIWLVVAVLPVVAVVAVPIGALGLAWRRWRRGEAAARPTS